MKFRGILIHFFLIANFLTYLISLYKCNLIETRCKIYSNIYICNGYSPAESAIPERIKALYLSGLTDGYWLETSQTAMPNRNIEKIEIKNSNIDYISPGYFAHISGNNHLKRLIIKSVTGKLVINSDVLEGLSPSLEFLHVRGNLLIDMSAISMLTTLTELNLEKINATPIPESFKNILPNLRSIEISNTNLTTMPWKAITEWVAVDKSRNLKINDNSWTCDCSIANVLHMPDGLVKSTLMKLVCAAPSHLKGKNLDQLSQDQLCPPTTNASNNEGILDGSSDQHPNTDSKTTAATLRMEVVIACIVVSIIILAFVIFIIVYKVRSMRKNKRFRGQMDGNSHHQSKKYCSVIENPTQANNTKYARGQRV